MTLLLLSDLLDISQLQQEIDTGYVKVQYHNTLPLCIYNYTPKCQYENRWNDITRKTRGLIVEFCDGPGDVVVARPFDKFFNYEDNANFDVESWDMTDDIEVTDKVDGSLGILYPHPDQPTGWAIATRGSFHSNQAEHATAWLNREHPFIGHQFLPEYTYLFEIIYPQNRIVVDYGQEDSLYLLAVRGTSNGYFFPLKDRYISLPRTQILQYTEFGDFLSRYRPPKGVEGCVVLNRRTQERVKFKTEEYCALHKIIFSLSAVSVWEALQQTSGQWLELVASLPTRDLQAWARQTATRLLGEYGNIYTRVDWAHRQLYSGVIAAHETDREWRKEVAQWVLANHSDISGFVFGKIDGKDISKMIFKQIKPRGDDRPTGSEEEMSG